MSLIRRKDRWEPFGDFDSMSNRMNQMLAQWPWVETRDLSGAPNMTVADWSPSCDITETNGNYRIKAELPAVKKEDMKVTLESGVLTIEGKRHEEKEEKDAKVHRKEVITGNFMRRFTMPNDADGSKIDAQYADGMLTVTIPKLKDVQGGARTISVK